MAGITGAAPCNISHYSFFSASVTIFLVYAMIIAALIFRFKWLRALSYYSSLFLTYLLLIIVVVSLASDPAWPALVIVSALVCFHLLSLFLQKLNWPRNPFFDVLGDLKPLRADLSEKESAITAGTPLDLGRASAASDAR